MEPKRLKQIMDKIESLPVGFCLPKMAASILLAK